ncbi:hypothetical protein ACN469_28365 [Corallococcus terminator]
MKLFLSALATLCLATLLSACGEPMPESPSDNHEETARSPLPPLPGEGEDPGGGGGGCGGCGGGSTPVTISTAQSSTPPGSISANVPMYPLSYGRPLDECRQPSHTWIRYSSPLSQGGTLTFAGVVAPSSKANFYIYNAQGQLVKTHQTHHSHDNCVIAHEQEVATTHELVPGTYYVYSSFWFIGAYLNGGWYSNGSIGPMAWTNIYVGSFTIQ